VNASGVLLVILGVWVATQVLGGQALERLGITTGKAQDQSTGSVVPPGFFSSSAQGLHGSPLITPSVPQSANAAEFGAMGTKPR
jgi:hypothetical protein